VKEETLDRKKRVYGGFMEGETRTKGRRGKVEGNKKSQRAFRGRGPRVCKEIGKRGNYQKLTWKNEKKKREKNWDSPIVTRFVLDKGKWVV